MSTFHDFSGLTADGPRLTARQTQILELIQKSIARNGAPPTRVEIATQLGFRSPNAAEDHLRALAKKGVIELVSGTSRGIRLRGGDLRAPSASPASAEAARGLRPSSAGPGSSAPRVSSRRYGASSGSSTGRPTGVPL